MLNEGVYTGEFLLSEGNGTISREEVVINAGAGKLAPGTVVAKRTAANSGTVTAGTNAGDATVGTVTVSNNAMTGTYSVTVTKAKDGAAPAEFSVVGPAGGVGAGVFGAAFSGGGVSFTITEGSPDEAVLGDSWSIAVVEGVGEYVAYDDDGTNDGRQTAAGILYAGVDATDRDAAAVLVARHAEVVESKLIGLDAAAKVDLAALGIICR